MYLTYVAPSALGADGEDEGEDVQDEHHGDDDDGRHAGRSLKKPAPYPLGISGWRGVMN